MDRKPHKPKGSVCQKTTYIINQDTLKKPSKKIDTTSPVPTKKPKIITDLEWLNTTDTVLVNDDGTSPSEEMDLLLSPEERQQLCDLEAQEPKIPLKYQIVTSHAPMNVKMVMMEKFRKMSRFSETSSEYAHELTMLQVMLQIPWGIYLDLPVGSAFSLNKGGSAPLQTPFLERGGDSFLKSPDRKKGGSDPLQTPFLERGGLRGDAIPPPPTAKDFLLQSRQFLESIAYGQTSAKTQLVLELSRYLIQPTAPGFILGVKGPPGSGKTTLISKGLSQLLHRPFARIDLGGSKHSDLLIGSRPVFDRSDMGDLVKILIQTKCMNPIIFLDELDKVSTSDYGHELINVINDLTDTTRNHSIMDQYLGIPIDLSRVILVFAYNSSDSLQETLRSRLHEITIEPYSLEDKIIMAQRFFIPQTCQKLGSDLQVTLDHSAIQMIIQQNTCDEEGVRELERQIDQLVLKLHWLQLTHQLKWNWKNLNRNKVTQLLSLKI